MKTIQSSGYPIHFQEDGYKHLNAYLSKNKQKNTFVLVDENTRSACLPILLKNLPKERPFKIIEIESGEINKNLKTCTAVWEALTNLGADRKSLLINLGGGVITDMGGFTAAAFKRGIKFINIPTTLLGMVDASVGGKTGVDLGVLKNQIGFFSDPEMVLVDTQYLKTLPDKEITSGSAEIIKYGLSYDPQLWEEVKQNRLKNIASLIHRSIEIKNEIVLSDRLESHLRKVLNFGHTLGHAVESHFLESDHKQTLTHGEAIGMGMIAETYLSHQLFGFPLETLDEIKREITEIFGKIALETEDYPHILAMLKHDKKNHNGQVNFVLLEALGQYKIDCKPKAELLTKALDYYRQ